MTDDPVKKAAGATMDALAERYRKMRAALANMKREYDEAVEPYLAAIGVLEKAMLMKLHAEKSTSMRTAHGTVYISNNTIADIVDFDALWTYMKENDRPDLLHKRLTLSAVKEINDENPEDPVPGVHTDIIQTISVRTK